MNKIINNIKELSDLVKGFDRDSTRIIMVNGCFDLFHIGHLQLLKFAKNQGDILIAAVNSDHSINRLKGFSRPIIDQNARLEILSSITYVDYVVLFEEEDPGELINTIKPNVIVKEEEYRCKKIPEIDAIKKCSAELIFYKKESDISTSSIIDKILELKQKYF